MKSLKEFLFKHVNIIESNGKEHKKWYVDVYSSAKDNDEAEESIGIIPNENSKRGIWLYRPEIKSIEVV